MEAMVFVNLQPEGVVRRENEELRALSWFSMQIQMTYRFMAKSSPNTRQQMCYLSCLLGALFRAPYTNLSYHNLPSNPVRSTTCLTSDPFLLPSPFHCSKMKMPNQNSGTNFNHSFLIFWIVKRKRLRHSPHLRKPSKSLLPFGLRSAAVYP